MSITTQLLLVLAAVIILNLASFFLYWSDKRRARNGEWRVSEGRLLLVSFFGPFGAYLSMRTFHHKTRKLKFLLVPLFMLLQVAAVVWVAMIGYA